MNLLGIDFEDWYHPEFIQKYISGNKCNPEVVNGIDIILELLRKNDTLATFFVVGELLEFKPELLDIILSKKVQFMCVEGEKDEKSIFATKNPYRQPEADTQRDIHRADDEH